MPAGKKKKVGAVAIPFRTSHSTKKKFSIKDFLVNATKSAIGHINYRVP